MNEPLQTRGSALVLVDSLAEAVSLSIPSHQAPEEEASCILGLFPLILSLHLPFPCPLCLTTHHRHVETTKQTEFMPLFLQMPWQCTSCFLQPAVWGTKQASESSSHKDHTLRRARCAHPPRFSPPGVLPPLGALWRRQEICKLCICVLGKMFCSTSAPPPLLTLCVLGHIPPPR